MMIREAEEKDLLSILKLYNQLNINEKSLDGKIALKIWKQIQKSKSIKYYLAEDDSKIVATCNILIIPNLTRQGKSIGYIGNVITDINYRKRGIGKKLIETAIEFAKRNNCYKVTLQSEDNRKEAHSFYESIGFDGYSKRNFELRL